MNKMDLNSSEQTHRSNKYKIPCPECNGTGYVVEYNVYDLSYMKRVICEYCNNTGFVLSGAEKN